MSAALSLLTGWKPISPCVGAPRTPARAPVEANMTAAAAKVSGARNIEPKAMAIGAQLVSQ